MDPDIKPVWSVLEFGIAEIPQLDKAWPGELKDVIATSSLFYVGAKHIIAHAFTGR